MLVSANTKFHSRIEPILAYLETRNLFRPSYCHQGLRLSESGVSSLSDVFLIGGLGNIFGAQGM